MLYMMKMWYKTKLYSSICHHHHLLLFLFFASAHIVLLVYAEWAPVFKSQWKEKRLLNMKMMERTKASKEQAQASKKTVINIFSFSFCLSPSPPPTHSCFVYPHHFHHFMPTTVFVCIYKKEVTLQTWAINILQIYVHI